MDLADAFEIRNFWCNLVGIRIIERRELIQRCNSSLKFCIYDEKFGKHDRPHFHAFINNQKVASVFLDTLEVDYLGTQVKKRDKKNIEKWVKDNKKSILEIRQLPDGTFEIPFDKF
ncbi:DUF4160 domain-containing protein [Ruminococcus sp. JL13D9]|uniref:DUF4160 domain-containing protein n=1 Tax=Ruminococcus sp. JL13D9 TaxID=3233381 RepID=UPI00389A6E43